MPHDIFRAALIVMAVGLVNAIVGKLGTIGAKRQGILGVSLSDGVAVAGILNMSAAGIVISFGLFVDFILWLHR